MDSIVETDFIDKSTDFETYQVYICPIRISNLLMGKDLDGIQLVAHLFQEEDQVARFPSRRFYIGNCRGFPLLDSSATARACLLLFDNPFTIAY